ncbi:hypothetical protein HHK36_019351 [Tetracentron sinense]|uniref:FAF domain-containing protein n=1 Tax=Tetracentron sinense TaxID=13715 RepID=A0A834YW36_TETSI|nr:hypothetical protein HHK36_019351 [Tetracentron sinense]
MAACSSLQHIFENPLPENPTLIESLSSWNQIKSTKPIELSSFTEIFGELHFKENHPESSSSSPCLRPPSFSIISQPEMEKPNKYTDNNENKNPALDFLLNNQMNKYVGCHKKSDSFSSMNSESLQLCTEGLGFESLDDVEDMKNESTDDWQNHEKEKANITKHSSTDNLCGEFRRSRTRDRAFPPPISCIGRTGKPCVCFKSYRHDGRMQDFTTEPFR